MPIIELNIRLDTGGLRETPTVIQRRLDKAVNRLQPYGEIRHRLESDRHIHNLIVEVRGEVPAKVIRSLARDLNQDCIAVYRPELCTGELIGPRAELWVRFRKFCFKRLDPALTESRKMTQDETIEYWECLKASLHARLARQGRPVTIIESDETTYIATIPQGRRPRP